MNSKKPTCNSCGKSDKVSKKKHSQTNPKSTWNKNLSGTSWAGYECSRCRCLVKEVVNES